MMPKACCLQQSKTMIRCSFEDKTSYNMKGEVPEDYYTIPLGKADIKREGDDITLFAVGKQVNTALEAAAKLSERGIEAEVLDPRSLSPLDEEAIFTSLEKQTG